MAVWMILGAFVVLLVIHEATAEERARQRLGAEYDEYVKGAFEPQRQSGPRGTTVVTRIAAEVISAGGRKAVVLDAPRRPDGKPRSTVVHEVNKDGTFSKKGPYFINWYRRNWSTTGQKHVIKTLAAPKSGGFEASNPGGGTVPEIGVQVVEWNTEKYEAVPARRYDMRSGVGRES